LRRRVGKQLECATYLLLRKRFGTVSYWRGEGEVDFVVEGSRGPIPVQVSWDGPTQRACRPPSRSPRGCPGLH